jgi:hypothetical protein
MPVVSSVHFLLGPVVALSAVGIIALLCRWVFTTDNRGPAPSDVGQDYGLLVPLTTVRTAEDAEMLQAVLREAGIRSNLTDGLELLVFTKDLSRARSLVSAT